MRACVCGVRQGTTAALKFCDKFNYIHLIFKLFEFEFELNVGSGGCRLNNNRPGGFLLESIFSHYCYSNVTVNNGAHELEFLA